MRSARAAASIGPATKPPPPSTTCGAPSPQDAGARDRSRGIAGERPHEGERGPSLEAVDLEPVERVPGLRHEGGLDAARGAREADRRAPQHQLLCDREGRHHVPRGAAGGDDRATACQSPGGAALGARRRPVEPAALGGRRLRAGPRAGRRDRARRPRRDRAPGPTESTDPMPASVTIRLVPPKLRERHGHARQREHAEHATEVQHRLPDDERRHAGGEPLPERILGRERDREPRPGDRPNRPRRRACRAGRAPRRRSRGSGRCAPRAGSRTSARSGPSPTPSGRPSRSRERLDDLVAGALALTPRIAGTS